MWIRACKVASFWKDVCIVGISVPAAVFVRVVVESVKDPSSHNLWPLELGIALVVGALCALAGAVAGSLIAKLFKAAHNIRRYEPY